MVIAFVEEEEEEEEACDEYGRELKMMGRLLMVIKDYPLWYKEILKFFVLLMRKTGLERMFFIPSALHMGGGMHGNCR